MPDAIEHRVAQPDVRGVYVNLRTQRARPVGKFPRFHSRKQIEVFLDRAIAKVTRLPQAAICVRFLGSHIADISFAFADKVDRVFVETVEIIRCVKRGATDMLVRPTIDQPAHVSHD